MALEGNYYDLKVQGKNFCNTTNFLIVGSTVFSCTEAARCYPSDTNAPSHDCYTRLLQKQPSDSEPLWAEVSKLVTLKEGYLIVDDTVLDKPYSENIGFVRFSGVESIIVLLREYV